MTNPDAKAVLAAARSSIGVSGWLAPIAAGRLFGIDATRDVSAAQYLRMGATRDFALAAAPFLTTGQSRQAVLKLAGACDIGDIIGVAIAVRRGRIARWGAVAFVAASLSCLTLSAKAHNEVTD